MPEYDNEKTGVLFPNDKRGNEKAPDVTGTAEIEGVEYRVAGWKRISNNTGKKFFSLKFETQEEVEAEADPEGALEL